MAHQTILLLLSNIAAALKCWSWLLRFKLVLDNKCFTDLFSNRIPSRRLTSSYFCLDTKVCKTSSPCALTLGRHVVNRHNHLRNSLVRIAAGNPSSFRQSSVLLDCVIHEQSHQECRMWRFIAEAETLQPANRRLSAGRRMRVRGIRNFLAWWAGYGAESFTPMKSFHQ